VNTNLQKVVYFR